MALICAPASVFAIIGRVAVDDEHELAAVHAVQDGFALRPFTPLRASGDHADAIPKPDPDVRRQLLFWERLRVLLASFPPPAADAQWMQQLAPLGLLSPASPYCSADPALAKTLLAAELAADAQLALDVKAAFKSVNGWSSTSHLFDYNLDYFELGTRNEPQWKLADRAAAHLLRAIATRGGLWGNHGYEAAFFQVWVDADGQQLSGIHNYEWTLPKPPPAKAFWSLTMYDVPDFFLVANPIKRYCISGVTPGLRYNANCSLTMYIQKDNPGAAKESNWLPTPSGDFRPLLSIFEPEDAAFNHGG